ncbi:MAG: hypothetical protein EA377_02015, partial [Phycisphaerales bacterium]
MYTGLAALAAVVVGMLGFTPDGQPDLRERFQYGAVQHNAAAGESLPLAVNHLRSIDDGPVVVLSSGPDLVVQTPTTLTSGMRSEGQRLNPGEILLSGSIINLGAEEITLVTLDGEFIVLGPAMNLTLTRQIGAYREFCLCWCEQHVDYVATGVPHGFDDMHEFCNGAAGAGCGGADGQRV